MKHRTVLTIAGVSMLLFSVSGIAQTSETQAELSEVSGVSELKVPPNLDQPERRVEKSDGSGLVVEEVRYNDRLGEVVIQHGEGGIREYYDMTNSDEIYQDGSLIDRGAMRSWRLGVGK